MTFFSFWRIDGGTAFEMDLLVDTGIALATFLGVSRYHDGGGFHRPGRIVGATGIVGLSLGGLALLLGAAGMALTWSDGVDHQKYRVVYRTTNSLAGAASRREERTGSFPANLDEVLAAGGRTPAWRQGRVRRRRERVVLCSCRRRRGRGGRRRSSLLRPGPPASTGIERMDRR